MRNTLAALIRVHKRQGIHTYLYGKYRRVFYHKCAKTAYLYKYEYYFR